MTQTAAPHARSQSGAHARATLLAWAVLACAAAGPVATALTRPDWLVTPIVTPSTVVKGTDPSSGVPTLTLSNGLVSRVFGVQAAGFATIDFLSSVDPWALTDAPVSMLRAVKPEARVVLDGASVYTVGGLVQQPRAAGDACTPAYFNRTACSYGPPPAADNATTFVYSSYLTRAPVAPFPWTPGLRGSPKDVSWPPKGIHLAVNFTAPSTAPPAHRALVVTVHYELYQGAPILAKSVSVAAAASETDLRAAGLLLPARGAATADVLAQARLKARALAAGVEVSAVDVEWLALNYPYANTQAGAPFVGPLGTELTSFLHVQTDQAHSTVVNWQTDPASGASPGAAEPVCNVTYTMGPGVRLGALPQRWLGGAGEFVSFRTLEVVTDTSDRERHGLSQRALLRLLAPQTMENPIFFDTVTAASAGFRAGADQAAAAGFEMIVYSFGSGFNMENTDPAYLAGLKADVAYAKAKGIEVGGYDLIALDRGHGGYGGNVGDQWDQVDPATGALGANACFASGWYDKLIGMVDNLLNVTGMSMVITDGPYGGGPCASTNHSHHVGLDDSVYMQTQLQAEMYAALKSRDIYVNQPDNYFYQGGSMTAMGYNEVQYNLPRRQDLSVSRAGMYWDTFYHTVTQGWMFLPLVDYHGGGAPAAFEPFSQHLDDYDFALGQYFCYGVRAVYRGTQLYDTPAVQAVVTKWVKFYKTHRAILISDLLHLGQPNMQGLDGIMHVNSQLPEPGLAALFNPTGDSISVNVTLPLYYTGIETTALVARDGGAPVSMTLSRDYSVRVPVTLAARSIAYFVVTNGDARADVRH